MTAAIIDAVNYAQFKETVGGKGANLFRLQAVGLPVPEFFCIGSEAFTSFVRLARNELEYHIRRFSAARNLDVREVSRQLKDALAKLPFPDELCGEIKSHLKGREDEFFAVRSSALQEDSSANSFAGLFKTSLFVRAADVPAHVLQCWVSAFEPGVLGYCQRKGIDPLELQLAVVVQRMVRSRVSGVMFTADPAGDLSGIVVVAGLGIGEGIVADLVETDTYRYDRASKTIKSNIQKKQFRIDFNESSGFDTHQVPVAEVEQLKPTLEPETLENLVQLGLRAESAFGDYQDIEWAIDQEHKLYVLQSRPITTIPPGEFTIFDNSNVVESYPGISLPLTFSVLKNGYERNFSRMVSALGIPEKIVQENRTIFRNMVGYIDGRIFYNLTNWYAIVNLNAVLGRRFTPAFNDMIGVRKDTPRDRDKGAPLQRILQLAVVASAIAARYFTISLLMRRYRRHFASLQLQIKSFQPEYMTTHELLRKISWLSSRVFSMIYIPLINDMLLMMQVAVTKTVMRRFNLQDPDNLLNGLMSGDSEMESVLPVYSIMRLAELLESSNISRDVPPAELMERIRMDPALGEVRAGMDTHIRLYGNRCPEELKLETDTFLENPMKLLETIVRHIGTGVHVADMKAGEARIRNEAETNLSKQLHGHPTRAFVLQLCIRKTRHLLRNREAGRLDRARIVGMFRTFYRALGRKLASENTFIAPDDVYYLTEDELCEVVNGSSVFMDASNVHAVVSQRRAMIDQCRTRKPEDRLLFRGTGVKNPVLQVPADSLAEENSAGSILLGTPCSPGVVEAEAVVIDNPSSAPDVRNKIIVARMTDPGWVFLMIASAGLIVEKGSLLSHTAIVGRELGIPTIVGVTGAANRIRTGQRIRMDASKGEIVLGFV